MNRREFLKGLFATGASIATAGFGILLPGELDIVSDARIDAIWNENAWAFDVTDYCTIWLANFREPANRGEAYGYTLSDLSDPEALSEFAEWTPLSGRLQEIYEEFRGELEDEAEDRSSAAGRKARRRLAELPDDPDTGWQSWLKAEPQIAGPALLSEAEKFLAEAPDDDEDLPYDTNAQGAAYLFFRDYEDADTLEKIGIVIVEGDHPGSSYFAAELTIPPEEANRIAERENLPYRFRAA